MESEIDLDGIRRHLLLFKEKNDLPEDHPRNVQLWEVLKRHSGAKTLSEHYALERKKSQLERDEILALCRKKYQLDSHGSWRCIMEHVESQGFDVTSSGAEYMLGGGVMPMRCSKDELAETFNDPAKSAIELYNKEMDAKFKFVEIEKVNWSPPCTYLITFTAADENDEQPKVFQAAADNPFNKPFDKDNLTVTLCRQKGNRLEGYMTGSRWKQTIKQDESGQPNEM